MQTPIAPLHDDVASDGLPQAFDAAGNPVEITFPPDLHDTHHLKLKALLLTVWVVFSFGTSYFARDLQALVPGWSAAYWMAAQGAVLMFMLIIVVYCVAMDHFERQQARNAARKLAADQARDQAAADTHDIHA